MAASPRDVNQLLRGSSRAEAKKSLAYRLYRLALKEQITNEEAVTDLYGQGRKTSYPPFRSLKTRLRHILVRAINLNGDTEPDYSTYDAALVHGYRQLNMARTFIIKEAFHAARDVADSAFQAVRKYEIVQLNEGLSDVLSALYLSVLYNDRLFKKYHEIYQEYARASFDLSKVAGAYRLTRSHLYMQKLSGKEQGEFALQKVRECAPIRDRNPRVSQIQAMVGVMEVNAYAQMGNYRMVVVTAEQVRLALEKCHGASSITISVMILSGIEATVRLRDFSVGKKQIQHATEIMEDKTLNTIKVQEYAILLGLRTEHYEYAYEIMSQVDYRLMNRLLVRKHHESWLLLEAYLNLLIVAEKLVPPPGSAKLRKFKMSKFLNSMPNYSRVKKGYNIQLLIVQVCFLIVQSKFDKVIDRTEALERYCSRYLRNNENFRNNCFFKMLIEAVKANFHRERTEMKTKDLYRRLSSRPVETYENVNDGEIIPYEELWSIVVEHLPVTSAVYRAKA